MTPEQCRDARTLLGWKRQTLAVRAQSSSASVNNFETRRTNVRDRIVTRLRAVLEAAGVEFTNGDAPGVRLRKVGV